MAKGGHRDPPLQGDPLQTETTETTEIANTIYESDTKPAPTTKNNEKQQPYPIIAKLEIPKINLNMEVLGESSKQALLNSICKFFGPKPNQIGNFCISGHNYRTNGKNMFRDLKKLSIDDELILSDDSSTLKYKIYDIFKVMPDETSSLSQKTNGKKEVTLITCTPDTKQRIIVKATQIE